MAVKRDNYGNIITEEFENHLKAQLRQEGYMEIIMYVPDTSIDINSISSTDKLDICNIESLKDIKKYTNITVATLEENLWLLNGRFPNYQNGLIDGYISNSISDENGEFTVNPTMKVQLTRTSSVENFSLILNPAVPTGYPKQIVFHCYDSGDNEINTITKNIEWQEQNGVDEDDQPIMVTRLLDTLPSVNTEINSDDVYYIIIEFIDTRFKHRRIRVSSVMFGKTIFLNEDQVINVDYLDKTSFVPDTLPSRTFSFDLNNYDGIYNIDNPNNSYIKLDKQTRVQFRNGYNVAGYVYNDDGTVKMENGFPVINNEPGIVEKEWDDWKELRLMDVSANADESVTFTCGSVLDIMEDTYISEIFEGRDRTVETIVNNVLSFEGLDITTVEWSSDGIIVPSIIGGDDTDTEYKYYLIDTVIPEVPCKQVLQLIAFAIGATILIKDNGKIKFANLNLDRPDSFTHQFNWNYNDFESIPAAEQLENIDNINKLSIPKYSSYLKMDGEEDRGQSVITTVSCNSIYQEVTYGDALINGARIKEGDTSGAQLSSSTFYAHRGIIRLGGLTPGNPCQVELIGYPIETQQIQEINVMSDSLVLDTEIMKNDPTQFDSQGIAVQTECIKHKYLEWYKKKFKYNITTRGEPLVDAGDYGIIQTQFTGQMPVYILQNHWKFDGTWSGDMEVIALG